MINPMKYLLIFCLSLSTTVLFAQAPQAVNYQAVARNADGQALADSELLVKVSIFANEPDGTLMWEEEHIVDTDAFGLFTLNIGEGNNTGNGNSPTFALINWGVTSYFLSIEVDPGSGYEFLGVSQLVSVPYALYANEAGNVSDAEITEFTSENQTITITEGGEAFNLDLGPMLDAALNGTSISLFELNDTELSIVEGDETFIVDLEPILDDGDWSVSNNAVYNDALPVGVGTDSPQSRLHIEGSVSYAVQTVDGPASLSLGDDDRFIIANVNNGAVDVTLPAAATCKGRSYTIKRYGALPLSSNVTVTAIGSDSIDGASSLTMSGFNGQVLQLISDGFNWYVLSNQTVN